MRVGRIDISCTEGDCYRRAMLEAGSAVPDVGVWTAPREDGGSLREILGSGLSLLAFYVFDWSPG